MSVASDMIIVLVVLTNLWLLGSSRLGACIRIVAIQGILLGVLPVLMHSGDALERVLFQAGASTFLKGVVFPWLLIRAVRDADVRREVEPIVGYTSSLVAGVALLVVALWLGGRMPVPLAAAGLAVGGNSAAASGPLMASLSSPNLPVGAALFNIMVGLFIIVSRRKALTQVLGYLTMENGIYVFGMAFAQAEPLLVELGILLDVFMAVFVMGIAIYHINREFDHIDTDRLSTLKDL